ncbi:hypothetical protein ACODT3_40440 [Streptomyces sp. 4.24]|uniref:hypothetical protein n=1 Tax=Streptomyces tritrimontium TaxID=3406573 RepID=UPI003BB6A470
MLRTDPEATRAAQARANKAVTARARAKLTREDKEAIEAGEMPLPDEVKADSVEPVMRPAADALMIGTVGAMVAAGGLGAVAGAVWPYVQLVGPWRGYVLAAGVAAWSAAAWMLSPTPAPLEVVEGQGDEDEGEPDPSGGDPAPAAAEDDQGDEDEAAAWLDLPEVAALVHAVAARHGHTGVHLADLLPEPLFEGWEMAELKTAFEDDWSVPVTEFKLRFKSASEGGPKVRERVRIGVRLADISARLEPGVTAPTAAPVPAPPAPPVEGAGKGPAGAPVRGLYLVRPTGSADPSPDPSQSPTHVAR